MRTRLPLALCAASLLVFAAGPASPKEPVTWSGSVNCKGTSYQCGNPQDLGYSVRKGEGFKIRYTAGAGHCATVHLQIFVGGKKLAREIVVPVGGDSGDVAIKSPRRGRLSVDAFSNDGCAQSAGALSSWGGTIRVSPAKVFRLSGKVTRSGDPVRGIAVEASGPNGSARDKTNKRGIYAVRLLKGTYTVAPDNAGAKPKSREIKLTEATSGVNFRIGD